MELTQTKYKQTEVGLIPEDWDFIRIQSLIDDKVIVSHLDGNHGALYPRSSEFTDNGVPYITANDFLKGYVNFNNVRYLPISRAEQFQKGIAKNGDVLFAHNATVGPTAVLKTNLDYVILSTTATYFRTENKKLNNHYLRYFFESEFFIKQYSAVMRQSTRNQIPITQQRKFSIILPQTLKEQKAIATALSDVDDLIASLESLIAKKQAIKQGAMQQLLTPPHKGGKRLPGFSREWVEKKLGEVAENISSGSSYTNSKAGQYPLYGSTGQIGTKDYSDYKGEKILVARVGANAGTLYMVKGEYCVSDNTLMISLSSASEVSFIYYLLKIINPSKLIFGSGQPLITGAQLKELDISLPSIEEQKVISNILSDMEKELEQLETKKAKYQQLKQGMMQELLTGKTRLV